MFKEVNALALTFSNGFKPSYVILKLAELKN
jgi:hypothetical protein